MKRKNRIAFVLGGMGNGGAERVVSIIANNYASKGWQVDILTLLSSKSTYDLHSNVKIINLNNANKSRNLQLFDWVKGIRLYYLNNRPHRVVSFFAKINIIVLIALYKNIDDIIVSERNDPLRDGRSFVIKLLTNYLYPKTKKVVFQTKHAQSCFSRKVVKNSEIVPNPVTEFSVTSPIKKKIIVNVGKLLDQKNQELLIKSFSKLANEFSEYDLFIYGEGKNRKELENLIKSLGLTNRVYLPGWVSDIHQKVASSELFVLSSNYEGFSNALLEAMMIGVPCISTNCSGSNELIVNNKNGLLVKVGDIDELSLAIKKLLLDSRLANELAIQGKKDVQKFAVKNVIKHWEMVID